jgi:hypothetical protein
MAESIGRMPLLGHRNAMACSLSLRQTRQTAQAEIALVRSHRTHIHYVIPSSLAAKPTSIRGQSDL